MPDKTSNPLVSVIIPAYNQGQLLARAIDSAMAQSFESREIIVVNDGSTNKITREIAQSYGDKITYIEQANGGVAAARNRGIEAAKGELIALLDQDDRWLPQKLEAQVPVLQGNPQIALAHSSYYRIDDEGTRIDLIRLGTGQWKPLPDLLLEVPVSSCTTLFRKQLAVDLGGFDPELSGSDDWDLWLRMAANGYDFYCIGKPLSEYRIHKGMTSKDDLLMLNTGFAVLDKFYRRKFIPENALSYKKKAYLAKHLWGVAIFYGRRQLNEARAHLRDATRISRDSAVSIRLLRTLIQARAEAEGNAIEVRTVREAVSFLQANAAENRVPRSMQRRLKAHAMLVEAALTPTDGSVFMRWRAIVMGFLRNPELAIDRELWRAGRRRLRPRVSPGKIVGGG